MPVNLQFYKFSERIPKNNTEVWLVKSSAFYNTYGFELADVEYMWDDIDEDSCCSYIYKEGEPQPENTRLVVCLGKYCSFALDDLGYVEDWYWAPADDIDDTLFPEDANNE